MGERDQRIEVGGSGFDGWASVRRVGVGALEVRGQNEVLGHPNRLEAEIFGMLGHGGHLGGAESE